MNSLYETSFKTSYGEKNLMVYLCDILDFDEEIDILTTSAFVNSYTPSPRTVFRALQHVGISVKQLAEHPEMDLRKLCHVWLSENIQIPNTKIHRIGCIEFINWYHARMGIPVEEQDMLSSIKAYFQMLDIAITYGVKMDTIAMPLLGNGDQNISAELLFIPILNECVSFLKRHDSVKRICFIERNREKAEFICNAIQTSYNISINEKRLILQPEGEMKDKRIMAFISYASADKYIADDLCLKLEDKGVQVWYAPRDVKGPYAEAIAEAISRATHFIIILSKNSMNSQHVLNEIDLAFQGLPDKIKLKPLRIDETPFTPSVKYYLSRQHWMGAIIPPLEKRLDEFVDKIIEDI